MSMNMKPLTLYFWQNSLSPHQLPYIRQIRLDKRIDKVVLIVANVVSKDRQQLGWSSELKEEFEILVSPDIPTIDKQLQGNPGAIHLFSGIRGNQHVFEAFKRSLLFPELRRGIITEGPYTYDKPLWLHHLRFLMRDYQFVRSVDFVFAIGEPAVDYYQFWSKRWKVFPFAYCVANEVATAELKSGVAKFLFVGNLTPRKNIRLLIQSFSYFAGSSAELSIVGEGEEREMLESLVKQEGLGKIVQFKGKTAIGEIPGVMAQHDCLVLPSLHDGWGAVVNEALHAGLFVVCSDRCGAKTLIADSDRGLVFESNQVDSLSNVLKYVSQNIEQIRQARAERICWSEQINGQSIGRYLVDCLSCESAVTPPWNKK